MANFMQAAWAASLRLYTGLPSVQFGCLRTDGDGLEGAAVILGPMTTMMVRNFCFDDLNTRPPGML